MGLVAARLNVLQSLEDRGLGEKVVLDVAEAQAEIVQMLQDLLQSQLSQFTAGTAQTLSFPGLAVVLDELGLDVFS